MSANDSMRVTSLWSSDSTSTIYQKVGVRHYAKMDERVIQNLEKGLLLAQQRAELVRTMTGSGNEIYLAKVQILTDTGSGRGSHCLKVFLPKIPEERLVERQPEQQIAEVDPFDGLGPLFG